MITAYTVYTTKMYTTTNIQENTYQHLYIMKIIKLNEKSYTNILYTKYTYIEEFVKVGIPRSYSIKYISIHYRWQMQK